MCDEMERDECNWDTEEKQGSHFPCQKPMAVLACSSKGGTCWEGDRASSREGRRADCHPLFLGDGWYTRDRRLLVVVVVLCQGSVFPVSDWVRHCDAGACIGDAAADNILSLSLLVKVVGFLH